ncbi:molybdenum cofactor carrier protein [Fibrobacterota bacterium]
MQNRLLNQLPIIGVMGSGTDPHTDYSTPLGQWLARERVHLLTGGGQGVMEAVSKAYCSVPERHGLVIGVIPGSEDYQRAKGSGYPNRWVEIPIYTHLPLTGSQGTEPMSRNHINVLTSDVIIALPGSAGTASEAALALLYRRPIIAFISNRDKIPGLPDGIPVESDLERVKEFIRSHRQE